MKIPFFNKRVELKANPPLIMFADETKRGAIQKVLLPNYLFRPPFGTPRFKDVLNLRRLANTPQASMCKQTIIDEIVSIPWDIILAEEEDELTTQQESEIDEITNFLMNPNSRNQSIEYLMRVMLNDVLDIDSGIWVKQFDESKRMVEIVGADAGSFLKNPDIHGSFDNRDEIIPFGSVNVDKLTGEPQSDSTIGNQTLGLTIDEARHKGAYFQFGFLTSSRPIAFGTREIVWFEKNPQGTQIYGKSPVENINNVLQNLLYSIEYNIDYFEDNNVPKGYINLPGASEDDLLAFRERWNDLQLKTNQDGLLKKNFHRVPITNAEGADFIRVQFSSSELQLLENQNWFSKIVWASYGVTPSELGFTENSNLATEINQSKVFKRKAIFPKLRMIEYMINNNILSEWDFGGKYKFKFKTFDVDDEQKKWELYDLQIKTGARSINEIRKMEGLDEIDSGDFDSDVQEVTDEDLQNALNDRMPNNPNEKESEKRAEKKAIFDKPDEEMLMKEIKNIFSQIEKDIINALRKETKTNRLSQIKTEVKSFESIINGLAGFINLNGIKSVVNRLTELLYKSSSKELTDQLNQNPVQSNEAQIKFLANNTFNNIKGMEEDLENKLRQQLSFAVLNGEGIAKITERVKSVFDVSENRAEMIARTETARVENFGQLDAAKKSGIALRKYILIVNDARTTEVSKAMDRKYGDEKKAIPLDKNFRVRVNGKTFEAPVPPFMPNDRDSVLYTTIKE